MSQVPDQVPDPYYNSTLPYGSPNVQARPKRPTSVTVMAILGIVFGIQGVLGAIYGIVGHTLMLINGGALTMFAGTTSSGSTPTLSPIISRVLLGDSIIDLFSAAIWVIASIGALKLRPLALKTMMVWSWFTILECIVGVIVAIIWLVPYMTALLLEMKIIEGTAAASTFNAIFVTFLIVMGVIGIILPILYLALWSRPKVKAAFSGA